MAQIIPQWVESDEFHTMAMKLVDKYPEHFSEIDANQIVAYICVNKDKPESKNKPYDMTGTVPPESFTNSKTYFVKICNNVWERTDSQKLALVFSSLCRIDPSNPGKVKPFDYSDQTVMVNTFGANWYERGDLPNILNDDVEIR